MRISSSEGRNEAHIFPPTNAWSAMRRIIFLAAPFTSDFLTLALSRHSSAWILPRISPHPGPTRR